MKENQEKPPEGGRITRESLPERLPLYLYKQTKDFYERNADLNISTGNNRVSEDDVYRHYLADQNVSESSLIFSPRLFKASELYNLCLDIMRAENPNLNEISSSEVYYFFRDYLLEKHRARNERSDDLIRDDEPQNHVPLLEPEPLAEPDAKERLALENIDNRTLAAHVVQREATDPDFAAELKTARTTQHAFGEAAQPRMPLPPVAPTTLADEDHSARQFASVNHPDAWGPHLPAFAPRLWKSRDKKKDKDPAKFIREEYAEWMPFLSRGDLYHLDLGLYRRYSDWLDEPRKPIDTIVSFGVASRLDDAERGRRAREGSKASSAKYRAQVKIRRSDQGAEP